jgi:hypothetical protein
VVVLTGHHSRWLQLARAPWGGAFTPPQLKHLL